MYYKIYTNFISLCFYIIHRKVPVTHKVGQTNHPGPLNAFHVKDHRAQLKLFIQYLTMPLFKNCSYISIHSHTHTTHTDQPSLLENRKSS